MDANDILFNISDLEIQEAIIDYKKDINTFPIFYINNDLDELHKPIFLVELKSKLNTKYKPTRSKLYQVPYDLLSDRTAIYIPTYDLIVKYIIKNIIKKCTGFQESNEILTRNKLNSFEKNELNNNECLVKIDLFDFFNSIQHENLLKIVSNELGIAIDSELMIIIRNSLKIEYIDQKSKSHIFEKGLTIGNKPDEYLADFYLTSITRNMSTKLGIELINVADEIIFKSKNISSAREIFSNIEQILNSENLIINKNKTKILNYEPKIISSTQELKITINELFMYSSAGAFPAFFEGNERKFEIIEKENRNSYLSFDDDISENGDEKILEKESTLKHLIEFEITDYESSINFIKKIIESQNEIIKYQKKHPDYKQFHNIVFSQPKDFLIDFENLNFCLFDTTILNKLVYIIYKYPRSEYYSAIAINMLIFTLKNSSFCINHRIADIPDVQDYKRNFNHLEKQLTDACEFANYAIIELLKSPDIHEYQKYLILRGIFKNKTDYNMALTNYYFEAYAYEHHGGDLTFDKLPFKTDLLNVIFQLHDSSQNLALSEITNHLYNLYK